MPPALNTLPPAPLTSLLQARWRALGNPGAPGNPDACRAATALALVDRPVPPQLLGRALHLGQERLEDAVNTLRLHGLVRDVEQGLISLSHPLYPPLIRADTPPDERTVMAGQLAAELPDSDDRARLGRLAGHPLAVAWTRAARVAATLRQAHAMTEQHARALLETQQADDGDLLALACSLRQQGRSSEIPTLLDGLPGYEAGLERCLALQNLVSPAEVLEQFRALDPDNDPDSIVMHALYCLPLQLRLGQITEVTAELLRLERLLSVCSPVTVGYWHERMARLCSAQENWAGETEHGTLSLELALAHGDDALACRAYLQCAVGQFGTRNLSAAASSLEQLIALAERCGEGDFSRFGVGNLAIIRGELGDLNGARTLLARQVQLFERAQEPTLAYALHNLAAVLDELGDGAALEAGLRAEDLFACREHGLVRLAHERDANALRLARAGRATEARTRLDQRPQPPAGSLPHRLLALIELGEHAQALDLLDSLATWPEDAAALCMVSAAARELNHARFRDLCQAALTCAQRNHQQVLQDFARALAGNESAEAGLRTAGAHGWLRLLPRKPVQPATALPAPTTFLWTLGRLTLEHGGEFRPWRGRKVQSLLALLLAERVARGRGLTRLELISALWPDSEEEQATGTLRKTISRLREVTGSALKVQRTRDGHWQLRDLRSDLTLFLQACEEGRSGEALAWYGGAFLPDLDDPWIDQARDRLTMMRRTAVLTLAHTHPASLHSADVAGYGLAQIIVHLEALLRDDVLDTEAFDLYVRLGRLRPQHLSSGVLDMLRKNSAEMGDSDALQALLTLRQAN